MPLRNLPIKTGHLFMGLAVIMFIVTVTIFSGGKKEEPKAAAVKIETQRVVVPLIPINEGKTLSMNDVTAVKWPAEFLPKGSTFDDPYQVVGRVAKQDLFPGEPIFQEKVSGSNSKGGLPAIIPEGMRAISVAVTEVKGVAGFVKPGDRVDVLTTFEVESEKGKNIRLTRTVLQNVLVLASAQTMVDDTKYSIDTPDGVVRGAATPKAVDGEGDKAEEKPKSQAELDKEAKEREKKQKDAEKAARLVSSVTLALTPAQTETLALAEETGDIRLSLRAETDHATTQLSGVNFSELIGQDLGLPKPPKPPSGGSRGGIQVEFIKGTDKSTFNFD